MWNEELMNAYSAHLDSVEHLVLLAVAKGYKDLEAVKDFVFIADPSADLSYAGSFFNQLKNVERPKISQQIAEARDKGDLSENAEYDAAKDAQGLLELRISKLEDVIASARLIDESKLDNSKVLVLSKVRIRNTKSGQEVTYTLVAENEADFKSGKISVTSPIGKGLLGKKVGDKAMIEVQCRPDLIQ